MKIIKNNIIPFKGFVAITLWPFIFVRKEYDDLFLPQVLNHENIHGEQQKELFLVLFYVWYGIEYLIKLLQYKNAKTAYKNIGFEREAYSNQNNVAYLDERKPYAFLKYINSNIN